MKSFTATIAGQPYKVRLDDKVLARFLDWAATVLPNPLDDLRTRIKDFPDHIQELMARDALDALKNRRNANAPEIRALMQTPEGASKILALAFQRLNPALSETDVDNLIEKANEEHGPDYLMSLFNPE